MTGLFISGIPVILSVNALEATEVRTFPASRHRSARIRKKLIARHGGEFRMKPAAFRTPQCFVMHPEVWSLLDAHLKATASAAGPFVSPGAAVG